MAETPTLLIAFLSGLLLFFSPCVAPLIPAYIASISGVRLSELQSNEKKTLQREILKNSLLFIAGFSAAFILMGVALGALSSAVAGFQYWLNRIGGALVIILAFHLLGLLRVPLLDSPSRPVMAPVSQNRFRSALFGLSFGVTWTPCTGPVLAAVLALSATTGSIWLSAQLMGALSLGLAIPFLLTGVFTISVAQVLGRSPRLLLWLQRTGGVLLLALGILIFTGRLQGLIGQIYYWLS